MLNLSNSIIIQAFLLVMFSFVLLYYVRRFCIRTSVGFLVLALVVLGIVMFVQLALRNIGSAIGFDYRTSRVIEVVLWSPFVEELAKSLFWRRNAHPPWTAAISIGVSFGLVEAALKFVSAVVEPDQRFMDDVGLFAQRVLDPISSLSAHTFFAVAAGVALRKGRLSALGTAMTVHAMYNIFVISAGMAAVVHQGLVIGALTVATVLLTRSLARAELTRKPALEKFTAE